MLVKIINMTKEYKSYKDLDYDFPDTSNIINYYTLDIFKIFEGN